MVTLAGRASINGLEGRVHLHDTIASPKYFMG